MRIVKSFFAFAVILSASTMGAAAFAGDEDPASVDKTVLVKLHLANGHEIEASQLAPDKASEPKVLEYAQLIIDEHTAADEKVLELAQTHELELTELAETMPAAQLMQEKHDELMETLRPLDGAEFDLAYMEAQIAGHKKAIEGLSEALPNLELEDVKALVEELLPKLEHHLAKAEEIKAELTLD